MSNTKGNPGQRGRRKGRMPATKMWRTENIYKPRTSQTTRQERGVGQSMPRHSQKDPNQPTHDSYCCNRILRASHKEKKLSFSQLLSSGSLTSKSSCFINPRWKARVREGLSKSKPELTAWSALQLSPQSWGLHSYNLTTSRSVPQPNTVT